MFQTLIHQIESSFITLDNTRNYCRFCCNLTTYIRIRRINVCCGSHFWLEESMYVVEAMSGYKNQCVLWKPCLGSHS